MERSKGKADRFLRPKIFSGSTMNYLFLVGLIATGLVLFVVTALVTHNRSAIDHNEKAVSYICSTTQILDALVVQVRDQIDAGFKNGTFQALQHKGIYTKAYIKEVHATRTRYQQAHLKLQHNGACKN